MKTNELLEPKELQETKPERKTFEKKKTSQKKSFSIKIKYKTVIKFVILLTVLIIGIIIGLKINSYPSSGNSASPIVVNPIINPTPDIDVTYLNTALQEASELTTAKLRISGLVEFKDTGVIIFNKSDFIMKYTADISAGIDMSKVKIHENDIDHKKKKIVVRIPKASVFKPNVYHGDKYIKFYDERFSLFNVNEKEDLTRALALAEEDAKKEAVNNGLLKLADKQSKTLIKGILSDTVSSTGYTIEIKYLDKERK